MSVRYITTILVATFTEILRMKTFGLLGIFSILLMLIPCLPLPHFETITDKGEELRLYQSTAMGAITLFSILFAITSTALLLPKDIEDRVVYTILCKPLSRLDYLIGKYLGVLAVIGLSLLLMASLMFFILGLKAPLLPQLLPLLGGLVAVLCKSFVVASIALCVSTFSSSTLFTIIVTTLTYFIGHYVGEFYDLADIMGSSPLDLLQYVLLIFPDFRLFNVIDLSIAGHVIPLSIMLRLIVMTLLYCGIYMTLAWLTFARKEF